LGLRRTHHDLRLMIMAVLIGARPLFSTISTAESAWRAVSVLACGAYRQRSSGLRRRTAPPAMRDLDAAALGALNETAQPGGSGSGAVGV
ncbi:hypothetical protein, partial [Streptomyces sp. CA2R101]|uniref:hypothetical protein n=1 Tax=Streptomyces sp. CA2R101 TaxID=3120152 RepID=UPI003008ECF2